MRKLLHLLLLLVALAPAHAAKEKWLHLQSEHFDMLTRTSEKDARTLLVELEQLRILFFRIFPKTPVHDPKPTIILFDSDKQFHPYKLQYNGHTKETSAYYIPSIYKPYIVLPDKGFEKNRPTVFHECSHALLLPREKRAPTWLDEGLASVFASFTSAGDDVTLGNPDAKNIRTLNRNRNALLPLQTVFSTEHSSPAYNDHAQSNKFYAQSWLLVHYLFLGDGTAYRDYFARFLKFQKNTLPPRHSHTASGHIIQPSSDETRQYVEQTKRAFEESFAITCEKMTETLGDYLWSGRYKVYNAKIPRAPLAAKITSKPADPFDVEFALTRLTRTPLEESKKRMEKMTLAHPKSPKPHERLAELEYGDHKKRLVHMQNAADLGSDVAYIYFQLARAAMQHLRFKADIDFRYSDDYLAELRPLLDKAIALSPDYIEAHEALLLLEAHSPKMRTASISQSLPAIQVTGTNNPAALGAIALIAYRTKNYEKCRHIVDELTALIAGNPRVENPEEIKARRFDLLPHQFPSAKFPRKSAFLQYPEITEQLSAKLQSHPAPDTANPENN